MLVGLYQIVREILSDVIPFEAYLERYGMYESLVVYNVRIGQHITANNRYRYTYLRDVWIDRRRERELSWPMIDEREETDSHLDTQKGSQY